MTNHAAPAGGEGPSTDRGGPHGASLDRLARLARTLEEEHPDVVGGFAPDMLRYDEDTAVLDVAPGQSARGRWAARLARPDRLGELAFVPPELVEGLPVERSADVYSLAAIAYRTATGSLPLGTPDLGALRRAVGEERARVILRGLARHPGGRPSLVDLAAALEVPAVSEPRRARNTTEGVPGTPPVDEKPRSYLLSLLWVGAVSLFVGALWFIWLSWGNVSDGVRLLLMAGLTGLTVLMARGLEKAGVPEASATFDVLFTQMFWVLGGFLLLMTGNLDSGYGWSMVGAVVAGVSGYWSTIHRPRTFLRALSVLAGVVAAIALFVSLGGLGRVAFFVGLSGLFYGLRSLAEQSGLPGRAAVLAGCHVTAVFLSAVLALVEIEPGTGMASVILAAAWAWTRFFAERRQSKVLAGYAHVWGASMALLLAADAHHPWQFVPTLLFPLMAGADAWLARRRDDEGAEDRAVVVGVGSLWIVALAFGEAYRHWDELSFAVVGFATWGLSLALSWRRERRWTAHAAPLHLSAAMVLLGVHLSTGTWYGAATWFLLTQLVFQGLALTVLAKHDAWRRGHFGLAGLWAALSTAAGLVLLRDGQHWTFAVVWPYLPLLLLVPFLRSSRPDVRGVALIAAAALCLLPSVELVIEPRSLELAAWAALAGLGMVGALLFLDRDDKIFGVPVGPSTLRVACALVGLPPLFGFLRVIGHTIDAGNVAWVIVVAGVASVLYGLGLAKEKLSPGHAGAREVSLYGASLYLAAFTLWSLPEPGDYGFPLLLFLGGVALLVLGVKIKHRQVVFTTAATLVVNFWGQFFAKLYDHAPIAVLLIVFGAGVLAFAVLYEKRLKRVVDTVKSWPGI